MTQHEKENKRSTLAIVLFIFALLCLGPQAATAQEASGQFTGGSVIIGYDNRTCDSSLDGAIRYNSGTPCVELCDGSSWACAGGSSGSSPFTSNVAQVSSGGEFPNSCFIKTDGTLWCWGLDSNLAMGGGGTAFVPVQIGTDTDWSSVAAGDYASMAIKTDGTLWGWGRDSAGQLGNGADTSNKFPPVQESSSSTNWKQVSGNFAYYNNRKRMFCAVKTDGTAWCMGDNSHGMLGCGTACGAMNVPTQVRNSTDTGYWTDWDSISAGSVHGCGIRTDGTLWCWGYNSSGQLGDGTQTDSTVPVQENTNATNWSYVAAGMQSTCAVKTDGTLWCWGNGGYDQIGHGDTTDYIGASGSQVGTDTDWVKTTQATYYTCGLKSNNEIWCWGYADGTADLGNNCPTPCQEATLATDWTDVTGSWAPICGKKSDGTLWCWGRKSLSTMAPYPVVTTPP